MKLVAVRCAYCGTADGPFELDHVVPRSRGGPDSPKNLVRACFGCNRGKRDKLPSEWLDVVPAEVAEIERRICSTIEVRIASKRNARYAPKPGVGACYFCGKRVTVGNGFLELYEQEIPPYRSGLDTRVAPDGSEVPRGKLAFPGNGMRLSERGQWSGCVPVALLSHAECGPDAGYPIAIYRIERASGFWLKQISEKRWWSSVYDDAITRLDPEASAQTSSEDLYPMRWGTFGIVP